MLLFKSLGSVLFFFLEINTFIQQVFIKLIKNDSKVIYNVTNLTFINVAIFISNKCCYFELSIYQRILKNISFQKIMNQLNFFEHW